MTGTSLYKEEEIEDLDKVVEDIMVHDVFDEVRGREEFYRWCREGLESSQPIEPTEGDILSRTWNGILSGLRDLKIGFKEL